PGAGAHAAGHCCLHVAQSPGSEGPQPTLHLQDPRLRQGTWRGESTGRGTPARSRHERWAPRPVTRIPDLAQVTGAVTSQHGASRPWTNLSTKWSLTQLHWLLHFTDEKPEVKKERLIEWPCALELQAEDTVVGGCLRPGPASSREQQVQSQPTPCISGGEAGAALPLGREPGERVCPGSVTAALASCCLTPTQPVAPPIRLSPPCPEINASSTCRYDSLVISSLQKHSQDSNEGFNTMVLTKRQTDMRHSFY
ncbi:unnamed protein product, partial [Rangifer tarandus platyrhynchus]